MMPGRLYKAILCLHIIFCSLSYAQVTYTYDNQNRLSSVVWENGEMTTYHYDDVGNLIYIETALVCGATVSDTSLVFEADSTTANIDVAINAGCVWEASSDVNWITLTSPSQVTGPGSISIQIAENIGSSSRNGALQVAGQTVLITQQAPVLITLLNAPTLSGPVDGSIGQTVTPTLTWLDTNDDPQEQGYEVRWKPDSGSYTMSKIAQNSTSFPLFGLTQGATYFWNVRAFGDSVASQDSEWANSGTDFSFTVQPAQVQPNLSVSPAGFRFDGVAVGTISPPTSFSLTNSGDSVLDLGAISVSDPTHFVIQSNGCSNTSLNAGESCTLNVAYSSDGAAERTAILQIPSNDPDTPITDVSLAGTGREAVLHATSYPPIIMEGESVTLSVWFDDNSALDRVLNLSSAISVSGQAGLSHSSQITVPANQQLVELPLTATQSSSSNADRVVTLTVTDPSSNQSKETTVAIKDDDSRRNNNGNPRMSLARIIPGSDDDGDGVFEGDEDADYEVYFQNTGSSGISQFTVNFEVLDTWDLSFPTGSCIIGFLNPGQERFCDARLRARDDLPAGSYHVQVSWPGGSALETVTVANSLKPDYYLSVSAINRTMNPGDSYTWRPFVKNATDGFHINIPKVTFYRQKQPSGAIETLMETYGDVRYFFSEWELPLKVYAPQEPGTYHVWAQIDSDNQISETNEANNNSNLLIINVPQPAQSDIQFSTNNLSFGDVGLKASPETNTLTITNIGHANLDIGAITVSGPHAGDFTLQHNQCSDLSLTPSQSCTLDLAFSPSLTGARSALLSIESNDPDSPSATITLSGEGNAPPVLSISQPDGVGDTADTAFLLTWVADDPDNDAQINLFYSLTQGEKGTAINNTPISEDQDANELLWDTSVVPNGQWFIYGEINDGVNPVVSAASIGAVIVDHGPPPADLSIDLSYSSSPAIPGESAGYLVSVSNTGPNAANGVPVSAVFPDDILQKNWTCITSNGATCSASGSGNIADTVNLPSGSSITYTLTGVIDAASIGTLNATAGVTVPAAISDPDTANNTDSEQTNLQPEADLGVALSDSVDPALPSDNLTYTLTVNNAGPSVARDLQVQLVLPNGTLYQGATGVGWTFSENEGVLTADRTSLDVTDSSFTVNVTTPNVSGLLTADASFSTATSELNPINNTASETTSVEAPSVCVPITWDSASGSPGSEVDLPIRLGDLEGNIIESFSATILFPSELTFVQIDRTETLTQNWSILSNIPEPGRLLLSSASPTGIDLSGVLFKLRFAIQEGLPHNSCLDLIISSFTLNEGEPQSCPVNGRLCFCPLGDVSGDGKPSSFDASQILKHVVLLPTAYDPLPICAADVTCNGSITQQDASEILKHEVELIDRFPCESERGSVEDSANTIVSFPQQTFLDGDYFEIPIVYQSNGNISSWRANLWYDPDQIQIITATTDLQQWSLVANLERPGEILIAAAGPFRLPESGVIVKLGAVPVRSGATPLTITEWSINEDSDALFPEETIIEVRHCFFPQDLAVRLPGWPFSKSILDLIPFTRCER